MGRKNECGIHEDVDPFEGWGCRMGSGGFPEKGGIGEDSGCPNTEECWPPPKTDIDEVPPKAEVAAKGLGVDRRAEKALFGGAGSTPCLGTIPNGEGVDPVKTEGILGGMGSGAGGSSSSCSICSTKGCESSSASVSSIHSSSSS